MGIAMSLVDFAIPFGVEHSAGTPGRELKRQTSSSAYPNQLKAGVMESKACSLLYEPEAG